MAYFDVFKVNQAADALNVKISTSVGNVFTEVRLWTQDTFKDYTQAIDLSDKLLGTSNVEIFNILPSDIGESAPLTGIYFLEVVDDTTPGECNGCNDTELGVATDFARFAFCLVELLCSIEDGKCYNCNEELNRALTMKLYIDSMRNALQLGNFTLAIKFWKNLNRVCKSECTECCSISAVEKKGLGFQTIGNNLILY